MSAAAKRKKSAAYTRRLETIAKWVEVERVVQTAGALNAFVDVFVTEPETATSELLRDPNSIVPLRRIAYVTRELKSYASMVERDSLGAL